MIDKFITLTKVIYNNGVTEIGNKFVINTRHIDLAEEDENGHMMVSTTSLDHSIYVLEDLKTIQLFLEAFECKI